jgi:uncharacterized membrane protein
VNTVVFYFHEKVWKKIEGVKAENKMTRIHSFC